MNFRVKNTNGGRKDIRLWNSIAKRYCRFQRRLRRSQELNKERMKGYPDPRVLIHDNTYIKALKSIDRIKHKYLLDIGCADGSFTYYMAKIVKSVVAIDGASNFIKLARKHHDRKNIKYTACNVLKKLPFEKEEFDVISSSLTLMDIKSLDKIVANITPILKRGGDIIVSLTHPCFYSQGFSKWKTRDGFVHEVTIREKYVGETMQRKSIGKNVDNVSHYHRPISMYINEFSKNGLHLVQMFEPTLQKKHFKEIEPQQRNYKYFHLPPFIILLFKKKG